MPIYVYRCDRCSATTEAMQKASDDPLRTCPECGEDGLRKIIAPAGVIFKGSGFHKNDYGSSGRRSDSPKTDSPKTESPKPEAAPSEKKGDSAGEKKAGATESKVA